MSTATYIMIMHAPRSAASSSAHVVQMISLVFAVKVWSARCPASAAVHAALYMYCAVSDACSLVS